MNKPMYMNIDVKTCYSKLFDSLIKVGDLVKHAKSQGQEYVVITDEEKMFSYVEFVKTARKEGLKPIVGLTLNVHYEGHKFKVILYPKTKESFTQIMKLSSQANIEGIIDIKEMLSKIKSTVVVFEFMGKDRKKQMIENVLALVNRFSDVDAYIGIRINKKEHLERAQRLVKSATELKVPIVAVQNTKYWKGQEELIDLIQRIRKIEKQNKASNAYRSFEEIKELYKDYPEAVQNTVEIAKKCFTDYVLHGDEGFEDMNAVFPIPKEYREKDVTGMYKEFDNFPINKTKEKQRLMSYFVDEVLKNPTKEDDYKKYGSEIVNERIKYEAGVIMAKDYENYFLIVKDFVEFAKNNKKMKLATGTGRGSAGASYVAQLLNVVSDVNPLEYDFMFERFLNVNVQTHYPDVDIDIAKAFRGYLYQYAKQKYGAKKVAKVATFGKYAGKSNIQDLGKQLGVNKEIIKELSKLITDGIRDLENHKDLIARIMDEEPMVKKLIKMAYQIDGLPKNESIHPAGVVIAKTDIDEFLPVYETYDEETKESMFVIQLDKDMISEVGLNKIDFLGLRNLDVIDQTLKLIDEQYGIEFTVEDIPLDDMRTFELYQEGRLATVFQMDSAGMQRTAKMVKPKTLQDIFHLIAIYRPGSKKMIPKYAENRNQGVNTVWSMTEIGKEDVEYHQIKEGEEILKPILNKTNGIILYQEQIMRILGAWSGFDATEADVFRRGISKKETEKIQKSKKEFIRRSKELGRDVKASESIFELIEKFGEYGFNEPHAGHYGLLSYRTAYLKANYPTEYMSAVLNSLFEDTKNVADYINETFMMDVNIQKPTIKNPTQTFEIVKKGELTYGFAMIRGIGLETAKHIYETHKKKSFESFNDFMRRVDKNYVTKDVVKGLIYAGAFDDFGSRKEMEELYKEISNKYKNYSGFVLLEEFEGVESEYDNHENLENKVEYEKEEKESLEKEYAYHVFDTPNEAKKNKKLKNVNAIIEKTTSGMLFGEVSSITRTKDKNDKDMAFIKLNVGSVIEKDLTIFEGYWKNVSENLKEGKMVFVEMNTRMKNVISKITFKENANVLKIESDSNEFLKELELFLEKQEILDGFDEIKIVKKEGVKTFSVVMSKELIAIIQRVTNGKANLVYEKVQL